MQTQRGFTLLEVLVATTIFAFVSAAVIPSFIGQSRFNTRSEIKTEAVQAAQVMLDELRISDLKSMPLGGTSAPQSIEIGSRTYQVSVDYCSNAAYCPPNVGSGTRHLRANVALNGDSLYVIDTVYTDLK